MQAEYPLACGDEVPLCGVVQVVQVLILVLPTVFTSADWRTVLVSGVVCRDKIYKNKNGKKLIASCPFSSVSSFRLAEFRFAQSLSPSVALM